MVDLSLVKPQHLWYTIGLIATDGNLCNDGRHINITSADRKHMEQVKKALLLENKITQKARGNEKIKKYAFLQFGDVAFYKFLLKIGLAPKKSLTLGKIEVPGEYFKDFLRGIIDGDGSITTWVHRSNKNIQWSSRVVSASKTFIIWLKKEVENKFKVHGKLHVSARPDYNPLYILKFGKFPTKTILINCYYKNCIALTRKNLLAKKCLQSEDKLSKYGVHKPGW